jgi:hypothetical protein
VVVAPKLFHFGVLDSNFEVPDNGLGKELMTGRVV